jgi:hypothetical protein
VRCSRRRGWRRRCRWDGSLGRLGSPPGANGQAGTSGSVGLSGAAGTSGKSGTAGAALDQDFRL